MRWNFEILLYAVCLTASAAPFLSHAGEGRTAGGGGWHGQDEYQYLKNDSYPENDINPDADLRKRLVVEWEKVSMGYRDRESGVRKWIDDVSLRPDRELSIRCRLLLESADGKSRQPIDWFQGVRVIVSRLPEQKHDWSQRQEGHDAIWSESVRRNGEFFVTLSPGDLRRPVGKEMPFQVALSLGEKEGKRITWRNTYSVLPRSVTMLTISGPPAIDEIMQIINGAPSYGPNSFNPAKLVRAVNRLQLMGKDQAIKKLRDFLKIARDSRTMQRIDENIDTSDKTSVFLIVRLLFQNSDPNKGLPTLVLVPFSPIPSEADSELWPLHPLCLQNDLPFFLTVTGGSSGQPDQPERHVDWADKHGMIRSKPLRPPDNPMTAASNLASLPQTKRLYDDEKTNRFEARFYQQAWNSVVDADPRIPKPLPLLPANARDDIDWDQRVEAASKFEIRWSDAEQKYIMK